MDLRRLKWFFILILLGANIFMWSILKSAELFEQKEKVAMTDNISEILKKEMIILPGELVVPETPKASNYYLEKMFGSNEEMVVKFLGETYSETGERMYESSLGTLFINGDEFIYKKKSDEGSGENEAADSVEMLCRKEMQRLGIKEEVYAYGGMNKIPVGDKVIFTVKHQESVFFDAYVSFDIVDGRIVSMGGKNIISGLEVTESSNVYPDAESVLVGLSRSEKLVQGMPHRIISIRHGYYIGKGGESYKNILAIPVWQIAVDTGQIIHFDARNGRELEE